MTTFTFDGTSTSSVSGLVVRDVRRPMLGKRRDVYVEVPGRAGSYLFEDKPGDRQIEVTLAIAVADSATIRTAMASTAALFDLTGQRELIFSDQSDRFWLARLDDMSAPREQRGFAEWDVSFRCDPYAYGTSAATQSFSTSTTQPYSNTWAVTTAAATPYIVDVTPGTDITGGFTLTINGDALTYGSTVTGGSTVRINGAAYTVTVGGSLSMATVSGSFGELTNGTNSVVFSRAAGTAATTLAFQWRRRYI